MLDIKLIREKPDFIKTALARRGVDRGEIDRLLECDRERRQMQHQLDELRARRGKESRELGKASAEERDAKRAEMRELGEQITSDEHQLAEVEQRFDHMMLELPNLPNADTPDGTSERDNVVVRTEGEQRGFGFKPRPHWEIGERLGIIDFERGVKLSGTRFYVLKGAGARMQRALINWMLSVKREQGYEEIIPPLMVNSATATSTGHLPKNADTMYRDIEDDFWFIPTAEVPLTSLYSREIIDGTRLPIYMTAHTPCFRREKMSAGRDVRGIKRGHQFDKVEMVKLVRPEKSEDELRGMIDDASELCRRLKIAFRVVQLCSADISFASATTYDLEMWGPGCEEWLEVSSCSNCTDFQARRGSIRFRDKGGKPELVHTLNGSGLALPRTMIAVLENYQQEDGSIVVPEVIRPFMDGFEVIRGE